LAAEIKRARPGADVELVGEYDQLGMFSVVADGRELWNKHEMGGFPEPGAIVALLPSSASPM
jgi:predicted Rdx family selenoprotein